MSLFAAENSKIEANKQLNINKKNKLCSSIDGIITYKIAAANDPVPKLLI